MNYFILIIVAVVAGVLGYYLGQRSKHRGAFNVEQIKLKSENKDKILQFAREHGKVQNNDVEKLVGVSNATAERYLNELEKEGKLTQHGSIGPDVHYTLQP